MNPVSLLVVLIIWHFSLLTTLGQDPLVRFDHLNSEDGLSQNNANVIFQDSRGYLWFGTQDGLNRYDGYDFKVFKHDPYDSTSISHNWIWDIFEDSKGDLWIGTWHGLNRYIPEQTRFQRYLHDPQNPFSISGNRAVAIEQGPSGKLWVACWATGMNLFEPERNLFTGFKHRPGDPTSLISNYPRTLFLDQEQELWIGTFQGGLSKVEWQGEHVQFKNYTPEKGLSGENVISIDQDQEGNLWIATYENGLNKFDKKSETFTWYQHYSADPESISDNDLSKVFIDSKNNVWIGTQQNGLNRFQNGRFLWYRHNPDDHLSLSSNKIDDIFEDRWGILWISTIGIDKLDPRKERFRHYKHISNVPASLSQNMVWAFCEDQSGDIWIGADGDALNRLDIKTGNISRIHIARGSLRASSIQQIVKGPEGALWLATLGAGLVKYQPLTGESTFYAEQNPTLSKLLDIGSLSFEASGHLWLGTYENGAFKFDPLNNIASNYISPDDSLRTCHFQINTITTDHQNNVWIGGFGGGLCKWDSKRKTFLNLRPHRDDRNSLSNDLVHCIKETSPNILWIGTASGLNKYDVINEEFTHYFQTDGLPSDVIYAIEQDSMGCLWVSTNKGISRFEPKTQKFTNYDGHHGLQGNEFNGRSSLFSTRGLLYFGGTNGVNSFNPQDLVESDQMSSVIISSLKIFDKQYNLDSILNGSDQIKLPFHLNFIALEFSALDFVAPLKNQYAYQMEGVDQNWIYSADRRFASYTDLDPGKYLFKVKASNSDGVWNDDYTSLSILITPPPWKTGWAFALYGLLTIVLLVLARHEIISRERLRSSIKLERLELQKIQEIDRMRSRFFTNISHEFRTPLTLISGPLKNLLANAGPGSKNEQNLKMMQRNTNRLQRLINQLLDLSKLESGKLTMVKENRDIIQFLRTVTASFSSLAEHKKINFTVIISSDNGIIASFDPDKLEKIVYNLLSNALKFTPSQGWVKVDINLPAIPGPQLLSMVVADNGKGLTKVEIDKVFDRFYQTTESIKSGVQGTGIGLALTREIVELLNGEISVSSEPKVGTSFLVTLPIEVLKIKKVSSEALNDASIDNYGDIEPKLGAEDNSLPLILITEDNSDLRQYISDSLGDGFRLVEASNGKQGLSKALEMLPDLIISDLMMPEMDGLQFCKEVKTSEGTSHIPFIMLTAKATKDSKIQGLETGADDYIFKPFDSQELYLKTKNLLDKRQRLQEKLKRELLLEPKPVSELSKDEKFLDKIRKLIDKNLDNPDLTVELLSNEAALSRVQLYRKISALTGYSVTDFIRTIRLKKAAQLMEQNWGTVSDIGYEVGFNNLSYFSKCFRQLYGKSPSEYLSNP